MKTTYYGQSTFMLEAGGKKLLFDPFISPNPAAKDIDIHSLKPDYILVSHGHGDPCMGIPAWRPVMPTPPRRPHGAPEPWTSAALPDGCGDKKIPEKVRSLIQANR